MPLTPGTGHPKYTSSSTRPRAPRPPTLSKRLHGREYAWDRAALGADILGPADVAVLQRFARRRPPTTAIAPGDDDPEISSAPENTRRIQYLDEPRPETRHRSACRPPRPTHRVPQHRVPQRRVRDQPRAYPASRCRGPQRQLAQSTTQRSRPVALPMKTPSRPPTNEEDTGQHPEHRTPQVP